MGAPFKPSFGLSGVFDLWRQTGIAIFRYTATMTPDDFYSLANVRRGHFLYESGYHGRIWLDLETLCQRPVALHPFIVELCREIEAFKPDVICGPLIEGAFAALMAASELRAEFVYTLRVETTEQNRMFSVRYQLPEPLRIRVARKRVAVINDVISAGSAVRGSLDSLREAGADVVCIASLVVFGKMFVDFAEEQSLPLKMLLELPNQMWTSENCPLCIQNLPLQKLATH